MTDDLEITSGGVITIDSEDLRSVGGRLGDVGSRLQGVCDQLWRAHAMALHLSSFVTVGGIAACAHRVSALADKTATDAHGVGLMADTFEYAELLSKQEALGVSADPAMQQRMDELRAGDPDIEDRVTMLRAGWGQEWTEGTLPQQWDAQAGMLPMPLRVLTGGNGLPFGTLLTAGVVVPAVLGLGRREPGDQLTGKAPPVQVSQVSRSEVTPVTDLEDSLKRIPQGDEGQVVVEKYTFDDGSEKFVAYIDGTRSPFWFTDEPWDMGSNTDMYLHQQKSASYAATMQALEQAGVGPGSDLSLVTYSQGGAIGTGIAMDPKNDVGTWISAGNPTDPALSSDQTYVDLRHRGDLVSNLASGGDPAGTGSPESFTVRAGVGPGSPIAPHLRDTYIDTAGQVDASGDPRVHALEQEYFAKLGEAVSVERMEFQAKRP